MRLLATFWYLYISILELLFVIPRPKLWRFYFYFSLEYFFFSPYYYADKKSEDDFVFGFTPLFSFDAIYKRARKFYFQKTEYPLAFCDAGCGDGRGVFLMNQLYGRPACGMESNPKFIEKIMLIKSFVKGNLLIVGDDMFNSEFLGYGIIFITWTTFKEETEKKLIAKLEKEVMKDAIVVTLSYPINSDYFEQIDRIRVLVSWGRSDVYFHRKVK
ncbi:MAG: hypothetical protein WCH76_00100 [Candidatus Riflemargulisbacteria bacterium]